MTKKTGAKNEPKTAAAEEKAESAAERVEETPYEAVASICSVLVVGLFALTLLAQNYMIPSGSMENTLLVGDHLVVDRITFSPPSKWMPLTHYREPKRGDIVVFIKPVPDGYDTDGKPVYNTLVKRLVGVPGDRIHLHNGIVILNGVAQDLPAEGKMMPTRDEEFLDQFPAIPPSPEDGATEAWSVEFPSHFENGDLVVPPDHFFMMGDNRHNSLDSRYWGFVPRENIIGRPLFNYWSFETPDNQQDKAGVGESIAWIGHVAVHFFTETRWKRTLHPVR
jgi:signal peptidase I